MHRLRERAPTRVNPVPSRTAAIQIEWLSDQLQGIEQLVGNINGTHGEVAHQVVQYLHRPVDRDELIAFFVALSVALVAFDVQLCSPLRQQLAKQLRELTRALLRDDEQLRYKCAVLCLGCSS